MTALMVAAKQKHATTVKLLLRTRRTKVDHANRAGLTALMLVAAIPTPRAMDARSQSDRDQLEQIVEMLVNRSREINRPDSQGMTALCRAVKAVNLAAVAQLLERGATLSCGSRNGEGPDLDILTLAKESKNRTILYLLRTHLSKIKD